MEFSNLSIKNGLCISLGANIDSRFGTPIESLQKSRSRIENIIIDTTEVNAIYMPNPIDYKNIFYWSSLYQTNPLGIKDPQPDYINCLLLIDSNFLPNPSVKIAKTILKQFQNLESEFGREKSNNKRWLSRCLDIDILWWNNLIINENELTLPHPRFMQRNFVITPLAEILGRSQTIKKLNNKKWITH